MLKIMIVDDESLLRMAVKSLLDWEANGFMMLPDAANGQAALELFEKDVPDILLTDIKMPLMNGVELIKCVEANYPQVKTIVLSNYDDFAYVKEALTHGAVDYILKANITPESLIAVINNLKEKFLHHERLTNESLKRESEIQKSCQFLRNEFLKNLIHGDGAESEPNNELYQAGLKKGRFLVGSLLADNAAELARKYQGEEAAMLQNTALTILHEILATDEPLIVCSPYHFALILYMDGHSESGFMTGVFEIMNRFQTTIFRYANISFTIGISGIKETLSELPVAYRESVAAVQSRFYLGKGKIYCHAEARLADEDPRVHWMNRNNLKLITDSLAKGKADPIHGLIRECLADIAQKRYTIQAVQQFLADWIVFLRSSLLEALEDHEMNFIRSETIIHQINQCESLAELEELVARHVAEIETRLREDAMEKHSEIVGKALRQIRAAYDRNISLQCVAAEIKVNPSYLSRLFLKETGKNFIDYLTEYRVKKAMRFLQDSNLRIQDVAAKIGYQNPKYFHRVFKKFTGVSPQQHRLQSKEQVTKK